MKQRIIVRTTSYVTFAGDVQDIHAFEESGIVVSPNPSLEMQVFIPEQEIIEIICNGEIYSFQEFNNKRRM